MKDLTNAIIRLYLERGDLAGALKAANELENRALNNDEWREVNQKIPLNTVREVLVKTTDQKNQDSFIAWLENGNHVINLISFNKDFEKQINLQALKRMVIYHAEEGEADSEEQLCAGIPYLQKELIGLAYRWAIQAKKLGIAKGNIDAALKAAELSSPLNEEEVKDLLTAHVDALIEANQKEKNGSGKSQEVLTECKRILELFHAIPPDKQAIYEKIRKLIFNC